MIKLGDVVALAAELAATGVPAPSPTISPPQTMLAAASVTNLLCCNTLLIVFSFPSVEWS
jgi:hypothetical protein